MKKLLSMGDYYVSDFPTLHELDDERKKYSLDLYLDNVLGAPRLKYTVPPDEMYGEYWYRSGTNASMTNQLKQIAEEVSSRVKHESGDIWLDIACNDGTMFDFIPNSFVKAGIDPSDDTYYNESKQRAIVAQDYFSKEVFHSMRSNWFYGRKAKVITCIAMFYDLDYPYRFLDDVREILDDDGVFVLQMSYTPLMIKQLAFDNICHEHVYYYSLLDITRLLMMCGLEVVDVSVNETNGGSFRVYAMKDGHGHRYATQPIRDTAKVRVDSLRGWEDDNYDVYSNLMWEDFENRIQNLNEQVVAFLEEEVDNGKEIWGYGASTKGNTLLQRFGIDQSLVTAMAERSEYKFGRYTVGTNIPILPEADMREANPDYLLVLPWHFISEFTQRERSFLEGGGKFIVPCPKFEVIGREVL